MPVRERGARTDEAMLALRELFSAADGELRRSLLRLRRDLDRPTRRCSRAGRRSGSAAARRLRSAAPARLGDGWIPIWVSPERFAEGFAAELRAQADGREVTPAVVLPSLVGGERSRTREPTSRGATAREFATHAVERYCLTGSPAQCAERIAEYVEAGARHVVFNRPSSRPGSSSRSSSRRRWPVVQVTLPLADVRVHRRRAVRRRARGARSSSPISAPR